jgi:hypothetical protein
MGVFVGVVMMSALAAPAAAQGVRFDFSGGYQFFRFLEEGAVNVPAGWGASFAVGKEQIKFIGDVGGHYRSGSRLHTFQGGIEFSGKDKRVIPFGRVLTGVSVFGGFGNDPIFVLTPEAGVKLMANNRVGAQVSVGFPLMFNEGEHAEGFRIFAGIVIRK